MRADTPGLGRLLVRMLIGSSYAVALAAQRCSATQAAVIGVLAFSAGGGVAGSGMVVPLGEPYASLQHYIVELLKTAPAMALLMMPIGLLVLGLLAALAGWRRLALGEGMSRVSQCQLRVLLLGHVSLFLPILVWSAFSALRAANDPTFGLGGPATKPTWIGSPVISFLGHPLWLGVLTVIPVATWALAFRHVRRLYPTGEVPQCRQCDYILLGLTESRCPECGTPFDPREFNAGGESGAPAG